MSLPFLHRRPGSTATPEQQLRDLAAAGGRVDPGTLARLAPARTAREAQALIVELRSALLLVGSTDPLEQQRGARRATDVLAELLDGSAWNRAAA